MPRYAQRYQKYDEFIGDIAAFATENGWGFTAPQDIFSAKLSLVHFGEQLGWRRLSNSEDMLVVDISAPTILEYAKGLLITLPNNDYAQELRNWCDIFDRYDIRTPSENANATDGRASETTDLRFSKLVQNPQDADQLVKDLCRYEGNDISKPLFDLRNLEPEYQNAFLARLKEILFNYTGFQRLMAIKIVQVIDDNNPLDAPVFGGISGPITIKRIDDGHCDTKGIVDYFFKSKKPNTTNSCYRSIAHEIDLEDRYFRRPNHSILHEITHAYHYMLMSRFLDMRNIKLDFIYSAINSKFNFIDTCFPMLNAANMRPIVAQIMREISNDSVQAIKLKIAQHSTDPDCTALRGIFKTLINNGFGPFVFDNMENKNLSEILTAETIARAVYIYCMVFRNHEELPLLSYEEDTQTAWHTCEEIITMLGIVPFYTSGQKTMAIVDRQNQFVYEWRQKGDERSYVSESDANIYGHHSPLFPLRWSGVISRCWSAAIISVLKNIGINASPASANTFFGRLKTLASTIWTGNFGLTREIAFPQSFVFSNDDSSNLIPCDSTLCDGLLNDYVLATENQLLTALRNYLSDIKKICCFTLQDVYYDRLCNLLHRYFTFISNEYAYDHEKFREIMGLIKDRPDCIPLIRSACFCVFDKHPSRINFLISQIKERVPIGIDAPHEDARHEFKPLFSDGFEPFLSIHDAPSFERNEDNKEEFDTWVQKLKEINLGMKPLAFASDKPVVRKVLDDWNAVTCILKERGICWPEKDLDTSFFVLTIRNRMHFGKFDIVDILLNEKLININTRYKDGEILITPTCNNTNALEFLREKGANFNSVDDLGQSILHYGCRHASTLEALIRDYSIDVNKKDYFGRTFLYKYVQESYKDELKAAVDVFLKYEGKINEKDYLGRTVLHYADPSAIPVLIENGCFVDERDCYGRTALHCHICNKDIRLWLLTGKASVNIQDNDQKTPLHVVFDDMNIRRDSVISAVRDLIGAGADVRIVDIHEKKPIDYAREYARKNGGANDIVDLLAEAERNVQGDLAERAE
ncbi:MAG: hypothetical protein LBR89_02140 [Holosporales bacterium]|nr:hypothetical protein [Holosporales bacterium]